MEIIWTRHAEQRLREWEKKRGITRQIVELTAREPEQIVPGFRNAEVAQAKQGSGLLRVPFVQEENVRVILTVYWTTKIDKYWED